MDRNLPLILHSAVFNQSVGRLAGDELPIVLLAGREGGEAAGDVAVSAGLNTTNCQLENYNAFSCDISALFDLRRCPAGSRLHEMMFCFDAVKNAFGKSRPR